MELLYLWVEQYGSLKNFHIKLSDRFDFEFKADEYILRCRESERIIKDFWGKSIKNLNVIVGDNGAGKTTILRCIMDFFSGYGELSATDNNYFFVFFDESRFKIKVFANENLLYKLKIECNDKYLEEDSLLMEYKKNSVGELSKNKLIYLHDILNSRDYLGDLSQYCEQIYNYSVSGMIRKDFKNNNEYGYINNNENIVVNFLNNEIYRQLDFVYGYKGEKANIGISFSMPSKIKVNFRDNKKNKEIILEKLDMYVHYVDFTENFTPIKAEYRNKIKKLVSMFDDLEYPCNLSEKEQWIKLIVNNLFLNALKEITVSPLSSDDRKRELDCFLDEYREIDKAEEILEFCYAYFNRVNQNLRNVESLYGGWLNTYKSFIKWIIDVKESINFIFDGYDNNKSFLVDLSLDEKELFKDFFNHYRRTCSPFYYLDFSWGLSTGEYNLLSLYSRLYSAFKQNIFNERTKQIVNNFSNGQVRCTHILLLIDEADLSYHPRWQSMYIQSLLNFLKYCFKDYTIQLIITTHSPILLSDIPKKNVVFLKDGINDSENIQDETFGQNIYTLFNNAFVLDDVIGSFAKNKIEKIDKSLEYYLNKEYIDKELDKECFNLDEIKEMIKYVGEPVKKIALENKFKKVEKLAMSNNLKIAIEKFDNLSHEEKKLLIQYIIDKEDY